MGLDQLSWCIGNLSFSMNLYPAGVAGPDMLFGPSPCDRCNTDACEGIGI